MQTTRRKNRQLTGRCCLLMAAALTLSSPAMARANTHTQAALAEIAATDLAVPLVVESADDDDRLRGTVYGTIEIPFTRVRAALRKPRHWCDLMTLHLNVKSCTHASVDGGSAMRVYSGSKEFERPQDAERIDMKFRLHENTPQRLHVQLTAPSGPLGTFDHHVSATFSPVDATTTLVRFEYRYGLGFRAQLAIGAYLATVASNKVGFTATGRDAAGNIEYIDGRRGMVERNAVRYYLALLAFFAHTDVDADAHAFDARAAAAHWFDLTARFPRQLHELERDEYLSAKSREYREQARLQSARERSPSSGAQARRHGEPASQTHDTRTAIGSADPRDRNRYRQADS